MQGIAITVLAAASAVGAAQNAAHSPVWQMQNSGTTAGLRGIHSVDGKVAWASGTGGTVLKTTDSGAHWVACGVPDAATDGATLDFRGVQAWDAQTAIVMASGPGEKSRIYKTSDGCKSWKMLLRNPDKEGFWDAIQFEGKQNGIILGDPVNGHFASFITQDGGENWKSQTPQGSTADPSQQAVFAASNSSLVIFSGLAHRFFVTGGADGARFIECHGELQVGGDPVKVDCVQNSDLLPLGKSATSSGGFSLGFSPKVLIAVGGDYTKPNESAGTAAWSADGGQHWTASLKPPHGYRSTVQWSEALKVWIAAGTNGSDISRDDGKTWETFDDGNWNALSLPFVVGPGGRVARLNAAAISSGADPKTSVTSKHP